MTIFLKVHDTWRRFWPYFLLAIFGLTLYGRAFFFDLSYLDDNVLIVDHFPIISNFKNIDLVFANDVFFSTDKNYYRPLLNVSLMVDAAIGGTNLAIYHGTNIILHLLVAMLIFAVFKKMAYAQALAFFLSLIFLVHPTLSQAVAWIPGRNDSLLALFVLYWQERGGLAYYLAYLALFALGLLTKETAVILPFLLMLYSALLRRDNWRRPDFWLFIIGSGTLGFIWLLMRRLALGSGTADLLAAAWSWLENAPATLIYVGKLILPVNLGVFPILADSTLSYGLISLLILGLGLFFSRQRRWPQVLFGCAWLLAFLWPSFIRPVGIPDFLEHRLYLPFFGFLIFLAEIDLLSRADWRRRSSRIIGGLVIMVLSSITFFHIGVFHDRLAFWQAAAASSPHSPLVRRNLGVMYYFAGDFSQAVSNYQAALDLNSQEEMVHNNLGVIYLEQDRLEEAIREFKNELAVNPDYDKALFNLGEAYNKAGQRVEAERFWRAALAANPANGEARQRLLIQENPIQ